MKSRAVRLVAGAIRIAVRRKVAKVMEKTGGLKNLFDLTRNTHCVRTAVLTELCDSIGGVGGSLGWLASGSSRPLAGSTPRDNGGFGRFGRPFAYRECSPARRKGDASPASLFGVDGTRRLCGVGASKITKSSTPVTTLYCPAPRRPFYFFAIVPAARRRERQPRAAGSGCGTDRLPPRASSGQPAWHQTGRPLLGWNLYTTK
jgi:hypothetical protein